MKHIPDLAPCPWCGNALEIKNAMNPMASCGTEGCWMHERKIAFPTEDPAQVAQWNARIPCGSTKAPTGEEIIATIEMCAKAAEGFEDPSRDWLRRSVWDEIKRDTAARIRALASNLKR